MAARRLPLILGLLGLPWLIAACFPPLNHDSAAVLTWAQRMVAGERLYIDLIDVNPPMIFWLNLPPAAVAGWIGLPAPLLLVLWYAALSLSGLALALPFLPRVLPEGARWGLLTAAVGALLILPAHSFTQREHLLLALALPYLLHALARAEGLRAPSMMATAALFAVAVCLKPHFLALPAGVEAYLLVQRGLRTSLRDPVIAVMVGIGLAYLAAVVWLTPAYFETILPMMAELYTGAGTDWGHLLLGDQVPPLILGGLILGGIGWKHGPAPRLLLIFTLTATVAGVTQLKGWDYHFVTARGGLLLLAGWTFGHWLKRPAVAVSAGFALSLGYASLTAPPFAAQRRFAATPEAKLGQRMAQAVPHASVLWFTTSLKPQFSLVQALGQHYIGHYMSLWPLPELYPPEAPHVLNPIARSEGVERQVIDATAADLARKPDLIVVTDGASEPGFGGQPWDHLTYFGRDPRIAEALKAYRPIGKVDGWTLYKRTP